MLGMNVNTFIHSGTGRQHYLNGTALDSIEIPQHRRPE